MTIHGSQTPTQIECRHAVIVSFTQSSPDTCPRQEPRCQETAAPRAVAPRDRRDASRQKPHCASGNRTFSSWPVPWQSRSYSSMEMK
eukprot:1960599-Rhodomonas_salina.1